MSGLYRTYRGTCGELIRVPESSFGEMPTLHNEPKPFPFATLADAMGDRRDLFATKVTHRGLFEEAMARQDVKRILAA